MKFLVFLFLLVSSLATGQTQAQTTDNDKAWLELKKPGAIVLFRHANAPGGGDPSGFVLNNCATQRNLDEEGRAQARRIGKGFRKYDIKVEAVLTSQWCRTRDTAELAFPSLPKDAPAFNSFFNQPPDKKAKQTEAARNQLLAWTGAGTLVVVTHQVNITSLTGIYPASGEGIVVQKQGQELKVLARLAP